MARRSDHPANRIRTLASRPATLLGVGVVSGNVVDAAIELANGYGVDLMLIASRNQVERDDLGAGYVNGWNAARFAEYVRDRDKGSRILLARDHGGPWLHTKERDDGLSEVEAMTSAKASLEEDIQARFDIVHLDTSAAIPDQLSSLPISRLKELLTYCHTTSRQIMHDSLAYEIGTEEQSGFANSVEALEDTLEQVGSHCRAAGILPPSFVVVQTGTKVVESRNIGEMIAYSGRGISPGIAKSVKEYQTLLERHGALIKQHNTDYLPTAILGDYVKLGIGAANVAPEFGVAETRALVEVLTDSSMTAQRDAFLEMAFESRRWERWVGPDSILSDAEKAILAGHYVLSTHQFRALAPELEFELDRRGVDLRSYLIRKIKASILRYMKAFRLICS